jgi:3-isopropylmalate dehydrogenase
MERHPSKNVANPIAMVLSASMMLDWLADRHDDDLARDAARRMERAVAKLLAEGKTLTADLGGKASTSDVTQALISHM